MRPKFHRKIQNFGSDILLWYFAFWSAKKKNNTETQILVILYFFLLTKYLIPHCNFDLLKSSSYRIHYEKNRNFGLMPQTVYIDSILGPWGNTSVSIIQLMLFHSFTNFLTSKMCTVWVSGGPIISISHQNYSKPTKLFFFSKIQFEDF